MPRILETLSVYPNPYAGLDHEGRAAGVCPEHPEDHPGMRAFVGAAIDTEKTVIHVEYAPQELRSSPQTTRWLFKTEPVKLKFRQDYLHRIQHGDLVAADEATHKAAFGGRKFEDPKQVLARSRATAIAHYRAAHDEDPLVVTEDPFGTALALPAVQTGEPKSITEDGAGQ